MAEPVDLTTLGAGVSLPHPSHPIFSEPFPHSIEMSKEEMALKITVLENRLAAIEQWIARGKEDGR
jgi:hypothetical protein